MVDIISKKIKLEIKKLIKDRNFEFKGPNKANDITKIDVLISDVNHLISSEGMSNAKIPDEQSPKEQRLIPYEAISKEAMTGDFNEGIEFNKTKTDTNTIYTLRIPVPIKYAHMYGVNTSPVGGEVEAMFFPTFNSNKKQVADSEIELIMEEQGEQYIMQILHPEKYQISMIQVSND